MREHDLLALLGYHRAQRSVQAVETNEGFVRMLQPRYRLRISKLSSIGMIPQLDHRTSETIDRIISIQVCRITSPVSNHGVQHVRPGGHQPLCRHAAGVFVQFL